VPTRGAPQLSPSEEAEVWVEYGEWQQSLGYSAPTEQDNPLWQLYQNAFFTAQSLLATNPSPVIRRAYEDSMALELHQLEVTIEYRQPHQIPIPGLGHPRFLNYMLPTSFTTTNSFQDEVAAVVVFGVPSSSERTNVSQFVETEQQWTCLGRKLRPLLSDNAHILLDSKLLTNPQWIRRGFIMSVMVVDTEGEPLAFSITHQHIVGCLQLSTELLSQPDSALIAQGFVIAILYVDLCSNFQKFNATATVRLFLGAQEEANATQALSGVPGQKLQGNIPMTARTFSKAVEAGGLYVEARLHQKANDVVSAGFLPVDTWQNNLVN